MGPRGLQNKAAFYDFPDVKKNFSGFSLNKQDKTSKCYGLKISEAHGVGQYVIHISER